MGNDPTRENQERLTLARGIRTDHQNTNGKVFSKVLPFERNGGLFGTVPELLFEKKLLIPVIQQLILTRSKG